MGLLVLVFRRTPPAAGRSGGDRRTFCSSAAAAAVITVNWATYIYGVNNDRVVETSLGYFINPLVTVLMGVVILGERLRPLQWVAMGIASLAVVVLTLDYGRLPWIALVLAFSFGTYGLPRRPPTSARSRAWRCETTRRRAVRGGVPRLAGRAPAPRTSAPTALGHALLFCSAGIVTADPADLLRRRRHPGVDGQPRAAAVPRPDPAVRARRLGSARTCPPAAGSASSWSGSRWRSSPSRPPTTAAASCG